MKQFVFVVELLTDGMDSSYAIRLTNGQLVACAFDESCFYTKLDKLLLDFKDSNIGPSSSDTSVKE